MTKNTCKVSASSMQWLPAWQKSIQSLVVPDEPDLRLVDYRDILMKHNLPRLITLLKDVAVMDRLTKAYIPLQAKIGDDDAQAAIRQFLMNACWICKPRADAAGEKEPKCTPDRGDLKKDLLNLSKAAVKLAKQIQALSPSSAGPDSSRYQEARLDAGNPVGYILNRKNAWQSAVPQQPVRRLSELLRSFASDIAEEGALLQIAIDSNRQKSGGRASLHFAMDSLTTASLPLSTACLAEPDFPLVTKVIESLMCPNIGLDPATVSKRYLSVQKKKTRA